MSITFGILTKNNQTNVENIVDSILIQKIPVFEVIIVGDAKDVWNMPNVKVVHNEGINTKNHITRKKNIVIEHATKDTVVIMKDYIKLDESWYEGVMTHGDYDIVMNKIHDESGRRYLDWIWENPVVGEGRNVDYAVRDHERMFSPGAFTMAKKYVFDEFRFDEKMVGLGRPTDVHWSKRAMSKYSYTMNTHSTCVLISRRGRYPKFRRLCKCDKCKNIRDDKMLIHFGNDNIDHGFREVIRIAEYDDMDGTIRRLRAQDIHQKENTFLGKGIHGYAALVFGILCDADVVAIDAPTFLDQANREMYGVKTEYSHSFPDEFSDILKMLSPKFKKRILFNTPADGDEEQFNNVERIRLIHQNTVVVADWSAGARSEPVAITGEPPVDAVERPTVATHVFRSGNVNNYFHYIGDHLVPILKYCFENNVNNILLTNKEDLVIKFTKNILMHFNIEASYTHNPHNVKLRGMNPRFCRWPDDVISTLQLYGASVPTDIVYISRQRTKRYIVNEDEFVACLRSYHPDLKVIEPHNMSIMEQVETFNRAKIVFGQYGSGLTNVVFMNKSAMCVEIDKCYRDRYDKLCDVFSVRHELFIFYEGVLNTMHEKVQAEKGTVNIEKFKTFMDNLKT
tara:strand:- start:904 stop:2775 length:1872 start_codon:yes stop_codon:yes gene_type:complete